MGVGIMNDVYRRENIDILSCWIHYQLYHYKQFTIIKDDPLYYQFSYQDKIATIIIWPQGVVEEMIDQNDKRLFYLHYEFRVYHYATLFFFQMIHHLQQHQDKRECQVLMCCTGGLTTGFFADKMSQYCQINQLSYEISAASVFEIGDLYQNYDLILIAPQLRHRVPELSKEYPSVVIQSIDPVTFATYDCRSLLQQIEDFYRGNEE